MYFNSIKCRPCWATYMKKYKEKNPQKIKDAQKKHKQTESYKNSHLKYTYKIDLEQYNKMLINQKYVCAICKKQETGKHQNGKTKHLAVDHCHITGKIRGLLCTNCNKGLGMFKDKISSLEEAIEYLKTER